MAARSYELAHDERSSTQPLKPRLTPCSRCHQIMTGAGRRLKNGKVQRILACKVVVNRRLDDMRLLGNIANGDAVVAALGKKLGRSLEDSPAAIAGDRGGMSGIRVRHSVTDRPFGQQQIYQKETEKSTSCQ